MSMKVIEQLETEQDFWSYIEDLQCDYSEHKEIYTSQQAEEIPYSTAQKIYIYGTNMETEEHETLEEVIFDYDVNNITGEKINYRILEWE